MLTQRFTSLLILIVFVCGCADNKESSSNQPDSERVKLIEQSDPVSDDRLSNLLEDSLSITFRSFNGTWIGTDCDSEICFLPKGRVVMVEFGYAIEVYEGEYTIDREGRIAVTLPKYESDWPEMLLRQDKTSMFMIPDSGGLEQYEFGRRGGALVSSGDGSYWPFRSISSEENDLFREKYSR